MESDALDRHPFAPVPVPRWFAVAAVIVSLPALFADGVLRFASVVALAALGYVGGWLAHRSEK